MAEQDKQTEQTAQAEQTEQDSKIRIDKQPVRRFILFYTLRHLWKISGRKVNDLYNILFSSDKAPSGNKTLYDRILRLEDCDMRSHAGRLSDLTDLSAGYFRGETLLTVDGVSSDDWIKFIKLRKQKGKKSKTDELKEAEKDIKLKIEVARKTELEKKNPSRNVAFGRLVYFAEYGRKKAKEDLAALFGEIEGKMAMCHPFELEQAELKLLESHKQVVQNYLIRLSAVITIRKWKG